MEFRSRYDLLLARIFDVRQRAGALYRRLDFHDRLRGNPAVQPESGIAGRWSDAGEHDRFTSNEVAAVRLTHTSDITFTPVATIYLPSIFQNYVPSTAMPTLLSPANGAALNTIVPLLRWDSGDDPGATEFNYEASKTTTFDAMAQNSL